jgi:hypothetical protein
MLLAKNVHAPLQFALTTNAQMAVYVEGDPQDLPIITIIALY